MGNAPLPSRVATNTQMGRRQSAGVAAGCEEFAADPDVRTDLDRVQT